jgi:colanic acid biosynthesis protein WcaH
MFIEHELYEQIKRLMPIPCVDIILFDTNNRVLLLRRRNEPAAGLWWFPGGRVLFGESRNEAAKRKLREECSLVAKDYQEVGTYELFFNLSSGLNAKIHSITTLYKAQIASTDSLSLDEQSVESLSLTPSEWLDNDLSQFVKDVLLMLS